MILFSFILTEKCNWKCEYCQFPYIKNPSSTNINVLSKHLPYIVKIKNKFKNLKIPYVIEAQGGELGMLDYKVMKYFMENIDDQVVISTNGMIMKKKWLTPELNIGMDQIMWHVCESPGDFKVKDYNIDNVYINKGIVHNNILEINIFISKNQHITFNYVELEYDILKERIIFQDNYKLLYESIKNFNNVTNDAKKRIKKKAETLNFVNRNDCMNLHSAVIIDMVNETIVLCQRVPQNNIPLSRNNIIKRLRNFPRDLFTGDTTGCKSCGRLYSDKFKIDSIKTTLKNRRIKL